MRRLLSICALVAVAFGAGCSSPSSQKSTAASDKLPPSDGMRGPADFESIDDQKARSRALFAEIGKVLKHPRCVNCHPTGDRPMQGDQSRPHQPLVRRGPDGFGAHGMRCTSCHGDTNYRNVPGNPKWHLAPPSMAWEGKTPTEICRQIKDPERNGGMSMDELVHHMAEDSLVGYGWNPPEQFEPVPGSQELFGKLARAWVDTGAHCPEETRD
mgnify:CR=1 FL=1